MTENIDYGTAILRGFEYLLENYDETFVIGQGLWSPWYVGNSMTDLDKKFGRERVIDTPVSEAACTGAAVGASITGMKPIVVHPRMDFMLYAIDPIVNQAAKWSHMFGGQSSAGVTIRAIINRGGEQGAQHSQALHSWFAHIPGLRVVVPSTVADARDLLIASVLCPDPVLYIDDRWLYDQTDRLKPIEEYKLSDIKPQKLLTGSDLTIVASGYSTALARDAVHMLNNSASVDLIDVRVLNPFDPALIIESVKSTGRLLVIDGGWKTCGFASEVIAAVCERIEPSFLKRMPVRLTLPDSPAPTSVALESIYYLNKKDVVSAALELLRD